MDDDVEEIELDQILSVLENPIRRQILMKLSRDSNYPLQLSKELNVSQQAIMKHLKVLEESDFVVSFEERSDKGGPPRKVYAPKKRYCVRIDIGPNTYSEGYYSYRSYEIEKTEPNPVEQNGTSRLSVSGKVTGEMKSDVVAALPAFTDPSLEEMRMDLESIVYQDDPNDKIFRIRKILGRIKGELLTLETKRKSLLAIRERTYKEANSMILDLSSSTIGRDVLALYILEGITDIDEISERLNTRKVIIEKMIKSIDYLFR